MYGLLKASAVCLQNKILCFLGTSLINGQQLHMQHILCLDYVVMIATLTGDACFDETTTCVGVNFISSER